MTRSEAARINGLKSTGPKNPHTGSLKDNSPAMFAQKFWSRTKIDGDCLIWIGCKFKSGYGKVNSGGRMLRANRVAWELLNGPIPDGFCIRHTCDNPSCVKPSHLLVGTQKQNVCDMIERGRKNPEKGTARYNCKLDETKIREIRALAPFTSAAALSRRYGVVPKTISQIIARKRWKHVK